MRSETLREKILQDFIEQGVAKEKINYKMRDWLISRQRYWGAPIPIIYCQKCGPQAVPDDQLPVELPPLESYEPSDDGRSPLARVEEFVNTKCPNCDGPAQRETDTMDTFVDSSWYFLRFTDPHNPKAPFDSDKANYWLPVDLYMGGAEHAVAHLLFARFWTKFLCDEGLLKHTEPFKRLRNQGMIGGPDGRKMGKRYGNVVTPDDIIGQGYGADALRLFEMFIAPFDQGSPWNVNGVPGTFRFLQRLWTLVQQYLAAAESQNISIQAPAVLEKLLGQVTHKTIKKVTADLEVFSLNTSVAAMMEAVNDLYKLKAEYGFSKEAPWKETLSTLTQVLAPFAPHICEEIWEHLGHSGSVHNSRWPAHDEKYLSSDTVNVVVQVNGKLRAKLSIPVGADEPEIIATAKANEKVASYLNDHQIKKTIYVPGKLVNFVI